MSRIVKIYALINPIDKSVFYVGATEKTLDFRLKQHLWHMSSRGHKGKFLKQRQDLYDECKRRNENIGILLLEEVEFANTVFAEKKWFAFYSNKFELYQQGTGDFISQNVWPNSNGFTEQLGRNFNRRFEGRGKISSSIGPSVTIKIEKHHHRSNKQ